MKKLVVNLTDEEKDRLKEIAKDHDTSPGELLAAFVADLVCSERTGGSDERMYASNWLGRQCCKWFDGKLC